MGGERSEEGDAIVGRGLRLCFRLLRPEQLVAEGCNELDVLPLGLTGLAYQRVDRHLASLEPTLE